MVLAALASLAAGCSSSASSPAGGAGIGGGLTARSPSAHATSAPPFAGYRPAVGSGSPSRSRTGPANCGSQPSALAIVACFQVKAENTDVQIDTVQQGFYNSAPLASVKAAIVAEDSAWLGARGPVWARRRCSTGGTTGQIAAAACLLAESNARLDAIEGPSARRGRALQSPPDRTGSGRTVLVHHA